MKCSALALLILHSRKRTIVALSFLLVTSSAASGQFTPSKEVLRGITGVRLVVMFHAPTREEAFDEVKRPGVLRTLEDDTRAKLEKAGIPFSRSQFWNEKIEQDYAQLIVLVKLRVPNGFVHPVEPEVKLLQRVRLSRDPSVEFAAVSWSLKGFGNRMK